MNMGSNTNLLVYVALAVVVAVAVAFAAYSLAFAGGYSVSVSMRTASAGRLYPYNMSRLLITVNNTGGTAVRNLVVGLYLNGTEIRYYTATVPAHGSVALLENYTYTSSGNFNFHAVADPGRLLNIANRSAAQASISTGVSVPELPNAYESVPNANITGTQSFSVTGAGLYSASAIGRAYSLRVVDSIFSPAKSMVVTLFDNVYGYVVRGFGASVNYTNGASAYSVWLQGTVSPALVAYVTSSFRLPQSGVAVNGTTVGFVRTGNQTSMCTYYAGGWTKILVYANNSRNATCMSFAGRAYAPTEANVLVGALNSSNALSRYQLRFAYANSTELGTSLLYANGSPGVINLFQDNYGIFASVIKRHAAPVNTTAPLSCLGLAYDINGTHVCSYIVVPSNRGVQQQFGLVNTTEVTKGYTVTLYSLVNSTQLLSAHYNAAALINLLRLNESAAPWLPAFKSLCMFNNTPGIACGFGSFDYLNNTAKLNITNRLKAPIVINAVRCGVPGARANSNVIVTVPAGSSANIRARCQNYFFPVPALITSYNLTLNYTYKNTTGFAAGFLNVTTAGFG